MNAKAHVRLGRAQCYGRMSSPALSSGIRFGTRTQTRCDGPKRETQASQRSIRHDIQPTERAVKLLEAPCPTLRCGDAAFAGSGGGARHRFIECRTSTSEAARYESARIVAYNPGM